MTQVYLGRGAERRELALGKLLGEGAAGKVYALPAMPGVAAKLYHGGSEARRHEAKIDAMIANPPDLPPAVHERGCYPQIAWPQAKLFDGAGRFVGFLMPEIDFGRSTSLVNLLQKNSRRIEKLSDYYGYRVLVARNLASVFAELHRAGHHMIDMKPANLRFYPAVSWMAVVDTDGFSIAGRNGRIAADQLSDEYIAPESWKRPIGELGVRQDEFALAVIIFQLLNNGVHPFAGGAAGDPTQPSDLQARILERLYPYAMQPRASVTPSAASIHRMFRRGTRVMFDCAFLPGDRRPTAEEWRDHLDSLLGHLTACSAKPDEHVHFGAGCGFCAHEARIAAAKAAPRPIRQKPRTPQPLPQPAPRPQLRPSLPARSYAPPPRRAVGQGWGVLVAAALIGTAAYVSRPLWDQLIPSSTAYAADVGTDLPGEAADIETQPVEYSIVPPAGSPAVPLRGGPGASYAVLDQLNPRDSVVGWRTTRDSQGRSWIAVTRGSDGESGYVPQSVLRRAPALPGRAPVPCRGAACGAGSTDPAARALETRYLDLLAKAEGYDRGYLIEGQRMWQEQRQRCAANPDPGGCRSAADAQRMGDLQSWVDAARLTRQDRGDIGKLTPASLTELP